MRTLRTGFAGFPGPRHLRQAGYFAKLKRVASRQHYDAIAILPVAATGRAAPRQLLSARKPSPSSARASRSPR